MKVSLVVASGTQKGRVISLTGPEFLIGREQECDLRATNLAISKRHCALSVRDGKVYLRDLGSTNGTFVNAVLIQNAEVRVPDGASLRVGPLAFHIRIDVSATQSDNTPLPTGKADAFVLKPSSSTGPKTSGPASADTKPVGLKAIPAPKAAGKPSPTSSASLSEEDHNLIADTLCGLDAAGNERAPEGRPGTDVPPPSNAAGDSPTATETGDKKKDEKAKPAQTREEMTSVANDLLRRYTRRRR